RRRHTRTKRDWSSDVCSSDLFQIVTLPVEFDASNRAVRVLGSTGLLYEDELRDTRKVLTAAALTYVAGAAASILQLLRIILLARSEERRVGPCVQHRSLVCS